MQIEYRVLSGDEELERSSFFNYTNCLNVSMTGGADGTSEHLETQATISLP
jgi:hypothetical protein